MFFHIVVSTMMTLNVLMQIYTIYINNAQSSTLHILTFLNETVVILKITLTQTTSF